MKTGLFATSASRLRSRTSHLSSFILLATWAVFGTGCTHVAKTRAKSEARLQEHSRAFTTAVVDTLHAQPSGQRDAFTDLALQIARQDQRVEGFPLKPLPVEDFLGFESTNLPPAEATARREIAREELDLRIQDVQQLLATERHAKDRLLAFGEKFEQARNDQRLRWFKRGSILTIIAASLGAVLFFVPAALPLLGRLLAWCVARFPALAGTAGVVSVRAFDAVVKAIERTKSSAPHHFGNQLAPADSPALDELHLNLSCEMDAAHKALVRKRKSALSLNR